MPTNSEIRQEEHLDKNLNFTTLILKLAETRLTIAYSTERPIQTAALGVVYHSNILMRACDSIYSYFNMFSLTYGASPAVYYYYYYYY